MKETFTFNQLPKTLDELKALPEADLSTPFKAAALALVAFALYPIDDDAALEMLDFLRGPEEVSAYDRQFLRDRFSDKDYVPRSYFAGATLENNYEPSIPYVLEVSDGPYSYPEDNYATLYMTSAGADNPRSIRLRKKPSTGQWFVNEYGGLLMSIRTPAANDPWA